MQALVLQYTESSVWPLKEKGTLNPQQAPLLTIVPTYLCKACPRTMLPKILGVSNHHPTMERNILKPQHAPMGLQFLEVVTRLFWTTLPRIFSVA